MKNRKRRYLEKKAGPKSVSPGDVVIDKNCKVVRSSFSFSDLDRLVIRFVNCPGQIVEYSIQYQHYANFEWHEVLRYDASQTENSHVHKFGLVSPEEVDIIGKSCNNYAREMHAHIAEIKHHHLTYWTIYEQR